MRKKKQPDPLKASVKSEVASAHHRKTREGLTRVGIITSPIKGKNTQAKQWNRWTP